MRDLSMETYDVILVESALGLSDPAPVVMGLPCRTQAAAVEFERTLNAQSKGGGFDPASIAGKTFTWRRSPGVQKVQVPDATLTRDDVLTALDGQDAALPLYAKLQPGADIRMTTMTLAELRARGA